MKRAALVMVASLLGCPKVTDGDVTVPLTIAEAKKQLDAQATTGSMWLDDWVDATPDRMELVAWPVDGGGEIAEIVVHGKSARAAPKIYALLAAADGRLVKISGVTSSTSGTLLSTPVGPTGALLAGCSSALVDGTAGTTQPFSPIACMGDWPNILGRGAGDGRYVVAEGANFSFNAAVHLVSNPTTLPASAHADYPDLGGVVPRFVREVKTGVFEWVITDPSGSSVYGRSDTTETKKTTALAFPPDVQRDWARAEESGALIFDRGKGGSIVRWHVESDGSIETVAEAPPAPYGTWSSNYGFGAAHSDRTIPNADDPAHVLTIPTAYKARAFVDGAFKTFDVPLTPCNDDAACRRIGESTLLGVVNVQSAPIAIYAVWAWLTDKSTSIDGFGNPIQKAYVALIAAPVDRQSSGTKVCKPKAAHCVDAANREVCRADGTGFDPAPCDPSTPLCDAGACVACTDPARQCPASKDQCLEPACDGVKCGTKAKPTGTACTTFSGSPSVCSATGCGVCNPGDSHCGPPFSPEVCGPDGHWMSVTCPAGCDGSKCLSVTAIAAGNDSTCAILSSKTIRCWGRVAGGSNKPKGMVASNVEQVAIGAAHACLRTSTGLQCWGENKSGQLALGFVDATFHATPSAPPTIGTDPITDVTAGWAHTCATIKGDTWCWGSNSDGQVGAGPLGNQPTPQKVFTSAPTVVAGGFHTCNLDAAGTVACWGRNDVGQVGYGMGTFPTPTSLTVQGTALGLGIFHTCTLRIDGGVSCWGSGGGGQLGDGMYFNAYTPEAPISGLTASKLAAGGNSTFAIQADGTLLGWGLNDKGQIGLGAASMGTATPTPISVGGKVVQIAVGGAHACALLETGAVRCWGANDQGQVGDGTYTERDAPVDVTF